MFVVEVGTVLSLVFTLARLFGDQGQVRITYLLALDVWLFLTVLFANFATALAEARGKAQADSLRKTRAGDPRQPPLRGRNNRGDGFHDPPRRRPGRGRSGTDHSGRRRDRRRHRLGRRVSHYRRIGPGHPRSRRRPLRRHRGHARAFRSDRRADHVRSRQFVSGPHDRARRGGHPPAHAQRNRPFAGPVRVHADFPHRHGCPVADGAECRALHAVVPRGFRAPQEPGDRRADAGRPSRVPDPHDNRRPFGRHRHCRHGPGPAGQRAGQERQSGRSGRRHRHAAFGQDGHDHNG